MYSHWTLHTVRFTMLEITALDTERTSHGAPKKMHPFVKYVKQQNYTNTGTLI